MADTFPNGYANRLVSLAELRERHEPKMHPEYAVRIFACIEAADGLVGIGGSWRSRQTQADNYAKFPNTFAPPGASFHESHPWASGVEAYAAVDTVGRHARHYEAWNWMRDHVGRFGLCTFWNVNGEPWHTQFSDLPQGARTWKAAGSPDPPPYPFPGRAGQRPPDMPRGGPFGDFPNDGGKVVISIGWHGDLVRYAQRVIADRAGGNIEVDGDFGPQTERRVKDVQFLASLPPTGIVAWNGTWEFIDYLAGGRTSPEPPADVAVENVPDGVYWVQRGDSPWTVAERAYHDGKRHTDLAPTDPPTPGFAAADHQIRIPGLAGRTTVVVPGDDRRRLIQRLWPEYEVAALDPRFDELNGGEYRTLLPGQIVFLDAPDGS